MTWNYRVVQKTNPYSGKPYVEVCEVYYNDEGVPHSWTDDENYSPLCFETLEELKDAYDKIKLAFEKPVLKVVDGKLKEKIE